MAMRSDHQLVRDYVTAQDHLQYTNLPEGIVALLVTHSNLDAKHLDVSLLFMLRVIFNYFLPTPQIRFDLHSKVI